MISARCENEIATEQSYTQIEMHEVLNTLNQFFSIKIILSKKDMSRTSMTYLSVSKQIMVKIQQTLEILRPIFVTASRGRNLGFGIWNKNDLGGIT